MGAKERSSKKASESLTGSAIDLHRLAEEKAWAEEARIPEALSPKAARMMAHGLRVNQIELEMKNEELRRVQAELDAARARYFDLYNLAPVGYCTLSETGLILEANLTVAELLGVKPDALAGQPIFRFIHKEDHDIYCRHCKNLCEIGSPHACELRMLKNDGTEFWARLEAAALQCDGGAPGCRVVLSDITAGKQMEKTVLQRSRQLEVLSRVSQQINAVLEIPVVLRQLVDVALELTGAAGGTAGRLLDGKMVFNEYNKSGRLISIDYQFVAGCGVPGRVMQNLAPHMSNDAEHDPHVIPEIRKALGFHNLVDVPIFSRKGELLGCFEIHNKDGGFDDIDVQILQGLAASAGIALENAVMLADLKQAETALRESNELFSRFMHHAPIYTYIKEVSPGESRVLQASDNFRQMIGNPDLEMAGKTMAELFPAELAEKIAADDWAVVSEGKVLEIEESFNGRNYISIKFPIVQGSRTLLAGYTIDVTERRQAEEEHKRMEEKLCLLQKMEAVGRLAGGVAHDYNNMLQIILGNTEILLTSGKADPRQTSLLEAIATAGRRAADLTRQLLAFACKEMVVPQVLDISHEIGTMLAPLRHILGEKIELRWTPSDEQCFVRMDRSQLNRILTNLIVNARDAIAGSGEVCIEAQKTEFDEAYSQDSPEFFPSPYVLLSVSDNGCGMEKEMLDRIFEPFFTTKPEYLGCGLGLSSLYGIVRQNNGFIRVDSQVGKGTTFRIYLPPYMAEESMPPETNKYADLPGIRKTILLVDDEEVLLSLCRNQLERLGYTVLAFTDPFEALDKARHYEGDIHLMLTDVSMPRLQGTELARRLVALRPQMKCIFMSGYTSDILFCRQDLREEDLNFLQKPFLLESLSKKINEVLAQ